MRALSWISRAASRTIPLRGSPIRSARGTLAIRRRHGARCGCIASDERDRVRPAKRESAVLDSSYLIDFECDYRAWPQLFSATIRGVRLVRMDMRHALRAVAVAAATLMAADAAGGAQPAARWLIIVDDLHLDFLNTGQLRTLLRTIADELIRDGDQVALYTTGPSSVSVAWTDDRGVVLSIVNKIVGSALKVSDILAITQDLTPTNEVDYRATLALARVNEIIVALDAAADRRIGIVYISNGYVGRSPSLTRPGGARIPVFALDPRLLPAAIVDKAGVDAARWNAYRAATRNSLRALSEQSGGFALAEGQDLAAALARISDLVRQ